jgi:hypothetical protein
MITESTAISQTASSPLAVSDQVQLPGLEEIRSPGFTFLASWHRVTIRATPRYSTKMAATGQPVVF